MNHIDPRHIHISDYNYPLPDERIAKFPIAQRDHSKLLIYKKGEVSSDIFYHLPLYLPAGALMVFNNTKVIQARMHFDVRLKSRVRPLSSQLPVDPFTAPPIASISSGLAMLVLLRLSMSWASCPSRLI